MVVLGVYVEVEEIELRAIHSCILIALLVKQRLQAVDSSVVHYSL